MSKNLKNALGATLFVHIVGWSILGVVFLIASFVIWDLMIPDLRFIRLAEAIIITFSIIESVATTEPDL